MTKRKDGRWQETLTVNGKRIFFYGKTKAECLSKIREYTEKKEKGKTVSEIIDSWWAEHEPTLEEQSKKGYVSGMKRLNSTLGKEYIREITPPRIVNEITEYAATGKAEKTVRNYLIVLNLVFKYAVNHGEISINPVRDVQVPHGLPKKKRRAATSDLIQKIKDGIKEPFGLFAYMALYTGLRRGELLALRWSDINFLTREITVNKSVAYRGNIPYLKDPKTESGNRVVPILDALFPVLLAHKGKSASLIFPNKNGEYLHNHEFDREWKKYAEAMQMNRAVISHRLRKSYATMLFECMEQGVLEGKDVQEIIGHAQYSTTMDTYTEWRKSHQQKVFKRISDIDIA